MSGIDRHDREMAEIRKLLAAGRREHAETRKILRESIARQLRIAKALDRLAKQYDA